MAGSSSSVTNFSDPATSGILVTFSCSENLVLVGPNSSMCMDNGQWEPDPREIKCIGINSYAILIDGDT